MIAVGRCVLQAVRVSKRYPTTVGYSVNMLLAGGSTAQTDMCHDTKAKITDYVEQTLVNQQSIPGD